MAYTAIDAKYLLNINKELKAAGKSDLLLMTRAEFDKLK